MCSESHSGSDVGSALRTLMGDVDGTLDDAIVRVIDALTPASRTKLLADLVCSMIMDSGIAPDEAVVVAATAHLEEDGNPSMHERMVQGVALALASQMAQSMTVCSCPTRQDVLLLAEIAAAGGKNKFTI